MSERPILFSSPMVRAILAGTKSVTRRVVKPQPKLDRDGVEWTWPSNLCRSMVSLGEMGSLGPFGGKGDRLWVREKFDVPPGSEERRECIYRADLSETDLQDEASARRLLRSGQLAGTDAGKWRPSIHMPRWASRVTLEVVSVRVERLQEITEEEAKREGVEPSMSTPTWLCIGKGNSVYEKFVEPDDEERAELEHVKHHPSIELAPAKFNFMRLWDSINGKRPGCSWGDNPWVWRVEFRRFEPRDPGVMSEPGRRST